MIRIILRRFFRRLKYVFLFRNLFWVNESCKDCGHCFRIEWLVKDDIWNKVMNVEDSGGGSLCIDCFIERAEKKNVKIVKDDFQISVFIR